MAKEPVDLRQLDEKQQKLFEDYILTIEQEGFQQRQDFDYRRWQMDCALKQEFIDDALWKESYRDYNLDSSTVEEMSGTDAEELESPNKPDEYSSLYLPILLRGFRTYLVNMSNLCFPSNGDWLNLTRGFSRYFYDTGIEKFLPFVNDAWVDIIKTENQRFLFKEKYKTSMAEVLSYGNTAIGHFYNNQDHVVEPFVPGIGRCAIYPITNDWRKSNIVMYYDVNYYDLLGRTDMDQEIIEAIKPQTSKGTTEAFGSTRAKEHYENNVPFGKVRLHDFFLPSVYLEGDNGESFCAKNVYVTALIKPFLDDKQLEQKSLYILKVTQDVSPVDHGLLLCSFGTPMPGTFYQQGPLQPFLPHQYTANQFISQMSRTAGLIIDPPKYIDSQQGMMLDEMETEMPEFEPGAVYPFKMSSMIDGNMANSIQIGLSVLEWIDKTCEEGIGYSKGQSGSMHQGRKTAAEIKESYSGSQLNLVEGAGRFDEQEVRPSIAIRIKATQEILQEQVKRGVLELAEGDQELSMTEEQLYEQVLGTNPLFRRLLDYSGIQSHYNQFYKKVQAERLQDFQILQEIEQMAQQINGLYDLADSEIEEPMEDEIEALALQMAPVEVDENGNPKQPKLTDQLKQQAYQLYLQQEQQRRAQAAQEAKGLELEMKIKELTFADTKEAPAPSYKLFYEMLVAPVEDSDVVVTGSMSTISKELARQNLLMFLESIANFPPATIQKMDFDGVLSMLARANDVPLRDLMKDQSQIMREEEEQKKAAMFEQELMMNAAQVPGAQPPQM